MSSKPPRFTSVPPPCGGPPECAIRMWSQLHDPDSIEGERHIRADEQRLMMRRIQIMQLELDRANDRITILEADKRRLKAELAEVRRAS